MEIFIRLDRLPISELLSCSLWELSFTADIKRWLEERQSEDLHNVSMYIMQNTPDSFVVVAVDCIRICIGTKNVLTKLKTSKLLEYKFENFDEKKDENRGFSFKLKFAEWEPQARMFSLWRRSFERKEPSSEQRALTPQMDVPPSILRSERPNTIMQRFAATSHLYTEPRRQPPQYEFADLLMAGGPSPSRGETSAGQPREATGPRLPNETDAGNFTFNL